MADKGLVSKSTLQGFADEVRRLTESEQTGTPAEMLALLQAVEAGGQYEVVTGTFRPAYGISNAAYETGIVIPERKNYILFVNKQTSNTGLNILTFGVTAKIDGVTYDYTIGGTTSGGTSMTSVRKIRIVDFSNGTIEYSSESTIFGFGEGKYDLVYVGWNQ